MMPTPPAGSGQAGSTQQPVGFRLHPRELGLALLLAVVYGLLGVVLFTGELATLLFHGRLFGIGLTELFAVLAALLRHPAQPTLAWPATVQPLLPGPVALYTIMAVVAAGLATFAYGCSRLVHRLLRPPTRRVGQQRPSGGRRLTAARHPIVPFRVDGEHAVPLAADATPAETRATDVLSGIAGDDVPPAAAETTPTDWFDPFPPEQVGE